jgi:hypothetical protein
MLNISNVFGFDIFTNSDVNNVRLYFDKYSISIQRLGIVKEVKV